MYDGTYILRDITVPSSISGSGRPPREGNGYPLQYSCLENLMDRGAWLATYSSWGGRVGDD